MDMEAKFSKIKEFAEERISGIDGSVKWDEKKWEIEEGVFDISTLKGDTIEKASIGRIRLTVDRKITGSENEVVNPMKLNSCQLNIYPSNPLLPVVFFNLENRLIEGDSDTLGGYLSIFSMKEDVEIVNPLRDVIASKIKEYGKDKNEIIKAYDTMWQDLDWQFKGKNGIGMKIKAGEDDSGFVCDMLHSLLKNFFDCLSEFKDKKYSAEDEEKMFLFRHRLTEFILLKDPSSKYVFSKGLPLETMSSMILPPVVRF